MANTRLRTHGYTSDYGIAVRPVDELHFGEVYMKKIGPEQLQRFDTSYVFPGMGGDIGEHGCERYHRKKTVYLGYGAAGTLTSSLPPQ